MANTHFFEHRSQDLQNDMHVLDRSQILDLIPSAALVYNRSEDSILSANSKFFELTSLDAPTLEKLSLVNLIPGKLDTNPTGCETRSVSLRIASGELIAARLQIVSLSLTNKIVALVFSAPLQEPLIRTELIDRELFLDKFEHLLALGSSYALSELMNRSVQIVKDLIEPDEIAVYLSRSAKEMHQVQGIPGCTLKQLPDTVSLEMIPTEPTVQLWRPHKKPTNRLQNLVAENGFQYLLTIPITKKFSIKGVIIATGRAPLPVEEDLRFFSLLSAQVSAGHANLESLESARKSLKRARQMVQVEHAILDNLEEGIIILSPDLRIAEMNPAAEIMLGYASKEVFGQQAEMVLIGNETLSTLYKSAQQGISTIAGNNLSLNTRTGKSFLAQVLCIPVMTDDALNSIVLILRDLSQTEQIRQHTQQLEQRAFLGEVSAIFAHEVKNPINSIMTGLQYIGMTMKEDNPHYNLVGRLQNDCLRLTHLMDSTLTFSKPIEYHFTGVDLCIMIPMILERWRPRMKRLNIHSNFVSNPEHPFVRADARALEQVFVNLISNAVQAMESSGGTLNIKINSADKQLEPAQYEVIIADSGPGIPDDLKEHIFEPFVTTNTSGTGLGLAISKRIITAHKGNIFVESFPGGTMFHVLLPKEILND